jgi:dephospho-CoA kinase
MLKNKIVIGIVGEISAGKGTATAYLNKKYKAKIIETSCTIKAILKILNQSITRKNLTNIIFAIRKVFGDDVIVRAILSQLRHDQTKFIVLDGLRKQGEINFLKSLPNFRLIYVTANTKIRYQRLIERQEKHDDRNKTFKQFLSDQRLVNDKDSTAIGKQADFKIDNSGAKKELYLQIDKIIKKINEKK